MPARGGRVSIDRKAGTAPITTRSVVSILAWGRLVSCGAAIKGAPVVCSSTKELVPTDVAALDYAATKVLRTITLVSSANRAV
jgi:hypothetical protein